MQNTDLPPDLKKWEAKRKGGMLQFIMLTGVLSWGLPMFLLMTFVVDHWWKRHPLTLNSMLVPGVIWFFAGIFFGWTIWRLSERKYQAYIATSSSS